MSCAGAVGNPWSPATGSWLEGSTYSIGLGGRRRCCFQVGVELGSGTNMELAWLGESGMRAVQGLLTIK